MVTTKPLTLTDADLFETLINNEALMINHVVLAPGKAFPPHPTDAEVYILILKGTLTATLADEPPVTLSAPQLAHIPYQTMSALSNTTDSPVELVVVKQK